MQVRDMFWWVGLSGKCGRELENFADRLGGELGIKMRLAGRMGQNPLKEPAHCKR